MTDLELGWIAGILEGEGHFSITGVKRNNSAGTPKAGFSSTDKDVIDSFQMIVGGAVGGPYQRGTNKPHWVWSIYGTPACKLMNDLYGLMSLHRRQQINYVFNSYKPIPKEITSYRRSEAAKLSRGRRGEQRYKLSIQTRERQSAASKIREEKKRAAKIMPNLPEASA